MKIISVNVGLPREVTWKGRVVTTGIFKEPAAGRIKLRALNLDGDRQADLSVHGGPHKAVYAYPAEHYGYWRAELPDKAFPWGMFGENLTTEGLQEEALHIGNRLRIGSAVVMVRQPRIPCYKLALKFGRDDIIKRFLRSGRSGFYFSVLEEGEVGAGDAVELLHRGEDSVTVADIVRLYVSEKKNLPLLQRAVRSAALPAGWRDHFQRQMASIQST